ncbi:large conductance mechanosensitive channel protein MscL, partial [Streptococcus pyogenes]|uniref:large conductance mechanosensitive channel protein MscL n=1 Tax=Streptococcus pyogenes TaxID=1314 RepID=UPI0011E879AF
MVKELKAFLFRGNIIELAVAVIIGGAIGAIVPSFVNDIITPLILNPALKAANVENITQLSCNGVKYGSFLGAVIDFLIIGS